MATQQTFLKSFEEHDFWIRFKFLGRSQREVAKLHTEPSPNLSARDISEHLSRNLTLLNFTELNRRFPIFFFLIGQTVTATFLCNLQALLPASTVYTLNICSITSFSHRKWVLKKRQRKMFSQMHFPLEVLQLAQLRNRSGRGGPEMSSGEQQRAADLCDFGFMHCCW